MRVGVCHNIQAMRGSCNLRNFTDSPSGLTCYFYGNFLNIVLPSRLLCWHDSFIVICWKIYWRVCNYSCARNSFSCVLVATCEFLPEAPEGRRRGEGSQSKKAQQIGELTTTLPVTFEHFSGKSLSYQPAEYSSTLSTCFYVLPPCLRHPWLLPYDSGRTKLFKEEQFIAACFRQ